MGKGSKRKRKDGLKSTKTHTQHSTFSEEEIDDEIDAFHKQRNIVPLNVNDDAGESDDDLELPVFDFEDVGDNDSVNSRSDVDDDEEEEEDAKGFAAKIARQAKYLQQKFGGADDEMNDDVEQEEDKKAVWGRKKNLYYNADNVDYELQSSDEDLPMEEEAEVVKIQKEKAKSLSMEDFGLADADQVESDSDGQEKAFQVGFAGKKATGRLNVDAVLSPLDDYEEIKKDLNALSKQEQMDVVYSSAPELVGLLAELNEALNQLKKVKPLLSEVVTERKDIPKRGMSYLEVKQVLLLAYCQAIGFYLLLKSEGHPVQDHPVIARLVEIKNLWEKMKQIDMDVLPQLEEIDNHKSESGNKLVGEGVPLEYEPDTRNASAKPCGGETTQLVKDDSSKGFGSESANKKQQDVQVGLQIKEMLEVRANLEAKLKEKGIRNLTKLRTETNQNHPLKPVNRGLAPSYDFDDEVHQNAKRQCMDSGRTRLLSSSKLSQPVSTEVKKPKLVSGDDDLPKRDDFGERRRKHELRVLSILGAKSVGDEEEDIGDEDDLERSMDVDVKDGEALESEDEFYKQVKKQRAAKLMAKAETRTPAASPLETEADGKRQITNQMEKNRGLTRSRKKLTKIPRKKYKIKHQKAVIRRKGQVRDIRKPTGPYGGEASGVNINVSRSIRFKN